MGIGSILSGVGGLVGLGSSIAGATTAGVSGAAEAATIQQGQQQANALLAPYATTGTTANNQLASLDGLNGTAAQTAADNEFQSAPGYQYQKQQGLTAIDQGAASKGMLQSGATVQAEQTFGSNLADQSFTQYYNQLAGLAGSGLNAAGSEASLDSATANSLAGITAQTAKGVNTSVQGGLNSLYDLGSGATGPNPVSTSIAAALPSQFGTGTGDAAGTSAGTTPTTGF